MIPFQKIQGQGPQPIAAPAQGGERLDGLVGQLASPQAAPLDPRIREVP